ncbi:FAD-dependent oxidoreductase [Alteromonas gracilis]
MTHRTVFERRPTPAVDIRRALVGARRLTYWLEDAPGERYDALRGQARADLVVVGGGYTGLWTALRAKERDPGRRVVLLEAGTLGWAASGRNGGFCSASLTHGEANGRERWPQEYDDLARLGGANLDGIEETVRRYDLDVDFERPGVIDLAVEPHQVDWLREEEGTFLDREAVRDRVHSPTYEAGLFVPGEALVHPAKLVAELARAAGDLGVEIHEQSGVRRLERSGSGMLVGTDAGSVIADRVALGTNVFPALVRRLRPYTVPVHDYAVMTEPLSAEQRAAIGWAGREGLGDVANQFHYYRLSSDDRILFGGYDALYHGRRLDHQHDHHRATYERLVGHLLTTFPQLEGLKVTHTWGGPIDTCSRFCAFFDLAYGGRVASAAGFTGLGVGATRFAADVMLDLLDGADTERTRSEMVRRKPVPFPPDPIGAVGIHLTRWSLDRADHQHGRRNLWLRALDAAGLGFDS